MIFVTPVISTMGSSPKVDVLEEFRMEMEQGAQELREWPLGMIRRGEPDPLEPVLRGGHTADVNPDES